MRAALRNVERQGPCKYCSILKTLPSGFRGVRDGTSAHSVDRWIADNGFSYVCLMEACDMREATYQFLFYILSHP